MFAFALIGWFLPGVVGLIAGDDSDAYVQVGEAANEGIVAIVAAALLFVLPVDWKQRKFTLNWNQAARIDWGTVLLFGGGIVLGAMLSETGLAERIGTSISDTLGVSSVFGITVVIVIIAVLISETTSNTASAAIVVPIAISIAAAADVDPTIPALAAIFGANYGFMLPVSTPPNAIVYSSGLLPITRMLKAGIVFDIIGAVLCIVRRDRDGQPGGARRVIVLSSAVRVAFGSRWRPERPPCCPGSWSAPSRSRSVGDLDASVSAVAAGVTVFFLAGAVGAGTRRPAVGADRRPAGDAGAALVTARLPARSGALRRIADRCCSSFLGLAGLANAVAQPAINLFMAEQVAVERQGVAFGIKQSAIPSAVLVSGLALPLLAIPFGWRATFAVCSLGPLAVAVLLARQAPALRPAWTASAPAAVPRAHSDRRGGGAGERRTLRAECLSGGLGGRRRDRGGHRRGAGGRGQCRFAGRAAGAWGCGRTGVPTTASGWSPPCSCLGSLGFVLLAPVSPRRSWSAWSRLRAGVGLAGPVQHGRRPSAPRGSGRGHRGEPDRHLRGGGRRARRLRGALLGPPATPRPGSRPRGWRWLQG